MFKDDKECMEYLTIVEMMRKAGIELTVANFKIWLRFVKGKV